MISEGKRRRNFWFLIAESNRSRFFAQDPLGTLSSPVVVLAVVLWLFQVDRCPLGSLFSAACSTAQRRGRGHHAGDTQTPLGLPHRRLLRRSRLVSSLDEQWLLRDLALKAFEGAWAQAG